MKKTFITLLALAGVAMGETVTYNILADQENWQCGAGVYSPASFQNDGSLYGSGWSQMYCNYRFGDDAITLTDGATLEWECGILVKGDNSTHSITLETATKNVVIGSTDYAGTTLGIGTSTTISDTGYIDADWNAAGQKVSYTPLSKDDTAASYTVGTTYKLSGSVTLTDGNYIMSVKVDDVEYTTVNLGNEFALTGVVYSLDGNNTTGTALTKFSLNVVTPDAPSGNIPEPATATLSLLALAGLCARRRRA